MAHAHLRTIASSPELVLQSTKLIAETRKAIEQSREIIEQSYEMLDKSYSQQGKAVCKHTNGFSFNPLRHLNLRGREMNLHA